MEDEPRGEPGDTSAEGEQPSFTEAIEATKALNTEWFSKTGGFLREQNPEGFRAALETINNFEPTPEERVTIEAFDQEGRLPDGEITLLLNMQSARQAEAGEQAVVNRSHVKSVFEGVRTVSETVGRPRRSLELAALVHDIAKWTPKSVNGQPGPVDFKLTQHEAEGAIDTAPVLQAFAQATGTEIPPAVVKRIQQIVLRHGEGEFPRDLERKTTGQVQEGFLPTTEADEILNGVDKLVGVNSESFMKYFASNLKLPFMNARIAGFMQELGPSATRLEAEFKSFGETVWKNYFRTDSRAVRDTFGREQLAEGWAFMKFVRDPPGNLPVEIKSDIEKDKAAINATGAMLPKDPAPLMGSFGELRKIFDVYAWQGMRDDEAKLDETVEDYLTTFKSEIADDAKRLRIAENSEAMPGLKADSRFVSNELNIIYHRSLDAELRRIAARKTERLPRAA